MDRYTVFNKRKEKGEREGVSQQPKEEEKKDGRRKTRDRGEKERK